jgi:hypothetical protein
MYGVDGKFGRNGLGWRDREREMMEAFYSPSTAGAAKFQN